MTNSFNKNRVTLSMPGALAFFNELMWRNISFSITGGKNRDTHALQNRKKEEREI